MQTKKFIIITRIPGRGMRTCGMWESNDGEHFEHVGEIAAPDDQDPEKTEQPRLRGASNQRVSVCCTAHKTLLICKHSAPSSNPVSTAQESCSGTGLGLAKR